MSQYILFKSGEREARHSQARLGIKFAGFQSFGAHVGNSEMENPPTPCIGEDYCCHWDEGSIV